MSKVATALEIKNFMGYEKLAEFNEQWKALSDEDKAFYREAVGAALEKLQQEVK